MKKSQLIALWTAYLFCSVQLFSQTIIEQPTAINTDGSAAHPSAILDLKSTTYGVLVPRMTTAQRGAIATPATGLLVFDTDTGGFWFYNGGWQSLSGAGILADEDNDTKIQTEESPDEDAIRIDLGGTEVIRLVKNADGYVRLALINTGNNVFIGEGAGLNNGTGAAHNTAVGYSALRMNTSGDFNSAFGSAALFKNTTGNNNSAFGNTALFENTTGGFNSAFGSSALYKNTTGFNNSAFGTTALYSNTTGSSNSAFGSRALHKNTTGNNNSAFGSLALNNNTTGVNNSAFGRFALYENTTGVNNSTFGGNALHENTTGNSNVAIGAYALYENTDRSNLVAVGDSALYHNGMGATLPAHSIGNTAVGSKALYENTLGQFNTAHGKSALYANTTGDNNTATGRRALYQNSTGGNNTAVGKDALYDITTQGNNTAVGTQAGQGHTFDNSTFLGHRAYPSFSTLTNCMGLGRNARPFASNQVRVGDSNITSIGGYAAWTNLSDSRFKTNVKEDVHGLDFILKLRPVTYQLDMAGLSSALGEDEGGEAGRSEKSKIRYTGFMAQEVEATAAEVGYDFSGVDRPGNEGGLYGLRYAEFTVPLVKAVQELADRTGEQQATIEKQQAELESLKEMLLQQQAALDALRAEIK